MMDEYKGSYVILRHGIEGALAAMQEQNFGMAAELLRKAQTDAEEAYISQGD